VATKRTTAVAGETPTSSPAPPTTAHTELELRVDVEPRKPRAVWQGMDRSQVATSVPTQVVEIVRPGRAVERVSRVSIYSGPRSDERCPPVARLGSG
jgi:hypothetical protein